MVTGLVCALAVTVRAVHPRKTLRAVDPKNDPASLAAETLCPGPLKCDVGGSCNVTPQVPCSKCLATSWAEVDPR